MNNTGKKNGALCLTKEYVEKSSYKNIFKKIYVTYCPEITVIAS